jgi:hypothetical protein
MGMSFRPTTNAAQAIMDIKNPAPAPVDATFRAMIAHLMSVGTFHGSLDHDSQFITSYVESTTQVATHQYTGAICTLLDNTAELSMPGMTSGSMVRKILDPVLADVFQTSPSWQIDSKSHDSWYGRIDAPNVLSIILTCMPHDTLAEGAHATIEIVIKN